MTSKRQYKENNLKLTFKALKQTKRFQNPVMFYQALFLLEKETKLKSFTVFITEIWQNG